jgi:hypothetical protein
MPTSTRQYFVEADVHRRRSPPWHSEGNLVASCDSNTQLLRLLRFGKVQGTSESSWEKLGEKLGEVRHVAGAASWEKCAMWSRPHDTCARHASPHMTNVGDILN